MTRPGTDPLAMAAGRLDWHAWPPVVVAAVEVLAAEVDYTAAAPGDLRAVVDALAGGYDVGLVDLADAAVDLAVELRHIAAART